MMNATAAFAALLFIVPAAPAQDNSEAKPAPLTMAKALKLGPEKLTDFTNPSEAGQDQAAQLYAMAKRIETEHALAQKNLEMVAVLDEWRGIISRCRMDSCHLAGLVNGGGTMYSHGANRDAAQVEDFLAGLVRRLPFAAGKGDPAAAKQLEEAIKFLKTLKPADPEAAGENKAALTEGIREATGHWEALKAMVSEIPAADAKRIAAFTVKSLGWLKEEE